MKIKGTLIPIGGNEDKGIETSEIYTLEYITDGILSRVVKESGGKEACIVVIPTASSIPDEVSDNYRTAFATLGCTDVHIMDMHHITLSHMKKFAVVLFHFSPKEPIIRTIKFAALIQQACKFK